MNRALEPGGGLMSSPYGCAGYREIGAVPDAYAVGADIENRIYFKYTNFSKSKESMETRTIDLETANGPSTAHVIIPENASGKAVILIQEWWGLNAHIKDVANRYANEGFVAVAPDLYRGKVTKDASEASQLMHALPLDDGIDTIKCAVGAASKELAISHFGITGFCMGGTFALRAACLVEGIRAAAPFYGDVPEDDVLKRLTSPTIFVSGTKDNWINSDKVATLEAAADKYELPIESLKYDADHAFFNDTRPEVYNPEAAADAWAKVIAFFNEKL